jgi:hypothetical protein
LDQLTAGREPSRVTLPDTPRKEVATHDPAHPLYAVHGQDPRSTAFKDLGEKLVAEIVPTAVGEGIEWHHPADETIIAGPFLAGHAVRARQGRSSPAERKKLLVVLLTTGPGEAKQETIRPEIVEYLARRSSGVAQAGQRVGSMEWVHPRGRHAVATPWSSAPSGLISIRQHEYRKDVNRFTGATRFGLKFMRQSVSLA